MADQSFLHRLPIGAFAARPRLAGAILIGTAIAVLLSLVPNDLRLSTRTVLSWDVGCLWFVTGMLATMLSSTGQDIRSRAAEQDEGKYFILALVLVAAAISLGVIAVELSLAKSAQGVEKTLRVVTACGTSAISWFVVHLVFATHYAHEYYSARDDAPDQNAGGLEFPNDDSPDYWDFLYFALVIGVAAQTADVSFTEKMMRRIGSLHSVVAFIFNTVVLALTVNLLASLF